MHGVKLVATPAANRRGTASNGRSRSVTSSPSASSGASTLTRQRGLRYAGLAADGGISVRHVLLEDREELGNDALTLERDHEAPVHEHRRLGLLEGTGQRDADVRVLGLTGAVHDAAHHGHLHVLDSRALDPPHRHLLAKVVLDLLSHLLEERTGGAPAAGAGRDLRRKAPETQRLEHLLRDLHLLGPVAAGRGGERHADGVADALLEQDAEAGSARDDAL